MTRQSRSRRLIPILSVLLAFAATATLAGESSPQRQAELDALVARHRLERQRKAASAARSAAEMTRWMNAVRASEMALARNLDLAQQAAAAREFQAYQFGRVQQYAADARYSGGYPSTTSYQQPVIFVTNSLDFNAPPCHPHVQAVAPETAPAHHTSQSEGSNHHAEGAGHMVHGHH